LNRFEVATEKARPGRTHRPARDPGRTTDSEQRQTRWVPTALASAAIATAIILLALPVASWIAELPIAAPPVEAPRPEALPIVRTSEMALARARTLYEGGKLKDALLMLDRITRTDPLRPEADRLRATVQRAALAALGLSLDEEKGPAR
jgi:hypothetical protein